MSKQITPEDRANVLHDLIDKMAESFQALERTTKDPEQRKAHMTSHMRQLVNECLSTCRSEVHQFGSGHAYDSLSAISFAFHHPKE